MRIDVRKVEQLKGAGNEFIGSRTRAKIVKNKVSPPFKSAEFDIMYGTGISKDGEILDMAVQYDIIHKGGSWFSYGDQRFQGRDRLKELIKTDHEFAAEVEEKIKSEMHRKDEEDKAEKKAKAAATAPVETKNVTQTRAAARAKLDIAIDDDDE